MQEAFHAFLLLFIIITYQGFSARKKVKDLEELRKLAAFICADDDHARLNIPLLGFFNNAQISLDICKKYKVSGEEEWEYAGRILDDFRKYFAKLYFSNSVAPLKSGARYVISENDYFLFMLFAYLSDNISCHKHIVFLKMHYITCLYCAKSPVLKERIASWAVSYAQSYVDDYINA